MKLGQLASGLFFAALTAGFVSKLLFAQPQQPNATAKTLNNIPKADQFPGANAGIKLTACISDLPAGGGTCDARGILGAQIIAQNIFSGQTGPVTLLLGAATYTQSVLSAPLSGTTIIGIKGATNFVTASALSSFFQATDQSDIWIEGIHFDGGNTALNGLEFLATAATPARFTVQNCTFTNISVAAGLNVGGAVKSLATNGQGSSFRPRIIRLINNNILITANIGLMNAYADDVLAKGNYILAAAGEGITCVNCTNVEYTDNTLVNVVLDPLEIGASSQGFTIKGNIIRGSAADAAISVESNSVRGTITGNTIIKAKLVGINVSFAAPGAAPFDTVHDITVSDNPISGDGLVGGSGTSPCINIYATPGTLGYNMVVKGNTCRGFNQGVGLSYFKASTISGNTLSKAVGTTPYAIHLAYVSASTIADNVADSTYMQIINAVTYAGNECANLTISHNFGGTAGGTTPFMHIEGSQTHWIDHNHTTGASHFIESVSSPTYFLDNNVGSISGSFLTGGTPNVYQAAGK